jgi:spore germination protein GerM
VFFGCQPASGVLLNAVAARRASVPAGTDARETALRVLLRGPTPDEKRAGYLSNFGPSTANVGFTLRVQQNGTSTVDFDSAIRNVKFIFVSMMDVAQIVAALGQFPEVRRVQILIGGQEWCRAMGEC